MKPRVTDGLDGRSLFDVGYLRVFLEIFSSLPGFATMFPFFSPDRQTMSSSLFSFPSKFRRKKRKVSKDRRVSFLYKYFQGNFIDGFTRCQAIMRCTLKCETMNSHLNLPQRERKEERIKREERECIVYTCIIPLMKLHLVNCLFREDIERCKSVSREQLRPLLNVVPRGQLSNPIFHRFVS